MKPHHDFAAERPLARHSGFGGHGEAQVFDPAAALARLAQRVAVELPGMLGALGGDSLPEVKVLEPREGMMRELLSRGAGPCSHGLVALPEGGPSLLVSIDAAGALQLVDLAFGGEGKVPDQVPEKLPHSAQLVVARIEAEIAALVAQIAGVDGDDEAAHFAPLRRNADIAVLRPFAADRALWQAGFEVSFGEAATWTVRLTMAADHAGLLCGSDDDDPPCRARAAPTSAPTSNIHPFAAIPLTLRATLVDMRMPLARIATLRPGDVLPISVARQVPLAVGGAIIAHGSVGEVDDRVALQITNAFSAEETRS